VLHLTSITDNERKQRIIRLVILAMKHNRLTSVLDRLTSYHQTMDGLNKQSRLVTMRHQWQVRETFPAITMRYKPTTGNAHLWAQKFAAERR
jgi:hypothetical protein